MAEHLKLYGPAIGNLIVTIGCYFHLKSKISEINTEKCDLTDILARLDKVEKVLNQILPALQYHDQVLRGKVPPPEQEGEAEVETEGPTDEGKDKPSKSKPKAKAKAKAKTPPPKAKSKTKTKAKPKAKSQEDVIDEISEGTDKNREEELDQELDEILQTEEPPAIELEATEAQEPQEEKPSPKKKSFKKQTA